MPKSKNKQILEEAQKIWDFLHLHQKIEKSDLIVVMGSSDLRVMHKAIQLYQAKMAPKMIVSGKFGVLTMNKFTKTEAETFAELAHQRGIPKQHIFLEKEATNTGENVVLTQQLIKEKSLKADKIIFIGKDYMERRILLTAQKYFLNAKIFVTSPDLTIEEFCNDEFSLHSLLIRLIGEIDRLSNYPEKGFINNIEIPQEILFSYKQLKILLQSNKLYLTKN